VNTALRVEHETDHVRPCGTGGVTRREWTQEECRNCTWKCGICRVLGRLVPAANPTPAWRCALLTSRESSSQVLDARVRAASYGPGCKATGEASACPRLIEVSLLLESQGFHVARYIRLERLIEDREEGYYRVLKQCSQIGRGAARQEPLVRQAVLGQVEPTAHQGRWILPKRSWRK